MAPVDSRGASEAGAMIKLARACRIDDDSRRAPIASAIKLAAVALHPWPMRNVARLSRAPATKSSPSTHRARDAETGLAASRSETTPRQMTKSMAAPRNSTSCARRSCDSRAGAISAMYNQPA